MAITNDIIDPSIEALLEKLSKENLSNDEMNIKHSNHMKQNHYHDSYCANNTVKVQHTEIKEDTNYLLIKHIINEWLASNPNYMQKCMNEYIHNSNVNIMILDLIRNNLHDIIMKLFETNYEFKKSIQEYIALHITPNILEETIKKVLRKSLINDIN